MTRFVIAAVGVLAISASSGSASAQAPVAQSCTLARCGLRLEQRYLIRGEPGDTVARPTFWRQAALPIDLLASDTSRALGERFNHEERRAGIVSLVGGLMLLGAVAVAAGHDADWGDLSLADRGDPTALWGTRTAVAGVAIGMVGSAMRNRSLAWRDRALWAHNLAVARQQQAAFGRVCSMRHRTPRS